MNRERWLLILATIACACFALAIACDTGDDDDDDDNDAGSTGDDDDDNDDNDDNDASPGDDDDDDDTSPEEWPGSPWYGCTSEDLPPCATLVTALDQVDQYYNGDSDNKRVVETAVEFPAAQAWTKVVMRVELECPADGDCDNWDRLATVFVVDNAGQKEETAVELWRYVTPYNIGMCMAVEVTDLGPLLAGQKTIRSEIDTWVGPESSQGHGWRVSVKFAFHPDAPGDPPDHVYNLWSYKSLELGNPDNPVDAQVGTLGVDLPATISRAELRAISTGHGQGNENNCAEFCQLTRRALVNGAPFEFDPWRPDCAFNPIGPDQAGTWKYPRNGWCPGAPVETQTIDVKDALTPAASNALTILFFDESEAVYENSCRPGAGDADNYCEGCAFDSDPGNCDYDGGMHTTPVDYLSAQLLVWE